MSDYTIRLQRVPCVLIAVRESDAEALIRIAGALRAVMDLNARQSDAETPQPSREEREAEEREAEARRKWEAARATTAAKLTAARDARIAHEEAGREMLRLRKVLDAIIDEKPQ